MGLLGSAARQRLLAIASVFDLSGAPSGSWSSSSSLVRRRPAVRVRPWAPNSIGPFPCIFCLTSFLQRSGKEISGAKRLVAQLLVVMQSPRHQVGCVVTP